MYSSLSGNQEFGSTVIPLPTATATDREVTAADGSGNWTTSPSTPTPMGTGDNGRDAAGNSSQPATVTVDSAAPLALVINRAPARLSVPPMVPCDSHSMPGNLIGQGHRRR